MTTLHRLYTLARNSTSSRLQYTQIQGGRSCAELLYSSTRCVMSSAFEQGTKCPETLLRGTVKHSTAVSDVKHTAAEVCVSTAECWSPPCSHVPQGPCAAATFAGMSAADPPPGLLCNTLLTPFDFRAQTNSQFVHGLMVITDLTCHTQED